VPNPALQRTGGLEVQSSWQVLPGRPPLNSVFGDPKVSLLGWALRMDASLQREPEINKLFRVARKYRASDLYLDVGSAPRIRLRGVNRHMDMRPLMQEDLVRLVSPILYGEQLQRLGQGEEISFTYAFEEGDAYRVGVCDKGGRFSLSAHWLGAG
jgi:hypothetical protein